MYEELTFIRRLFGKDSVMKFRKVSNRHTFLIKTREI